MSRTFISVPAALPVATHLVTRRRGYVHHGIYVGDGRVVHYGGLSASGSFRAGPVEEVSIEEFGRGRPVGVCEDAPASFGRDVVVARARSRLGENAYRILSNNCEHFCEWCLHGTSRSPQVEKWLGRPTRALLALMRRLVHIQPGAARGNAAGVSA
jgi:hypothetical protein